MEPRESSKSAGQAVAHRLGISSFRTSAKEAQPQPYNVKVEVVSAVCSRCANLLSNGNSNSEDNDSEGDLSLPSPDDSPSPIQHHQHPASGRTSSIVGPGSTNHSKSAWWRRWRWRRSRKGRTRRSCARLRMREPFSFQSTTTTVLSVFLAVIYFLFIVQLLPLPVFATATAATTAQRAAFNANASTSYASSDAGATFTLSSLSAPPPINSSTSTLPLPEPESTPTPEVHFRESGEPCTLDIECSGNLVCAKPPRAKYSYCDCDARNYTWSGKLQKCVGLVGSPCTNSETGDKLACVDNAYCDIRPELGHGVCECTSSYSPTRARTCQLRYGYPCVNQNYDNLCNKDQHLNCIEDVCRCMFPNQMKYDKERGQCRMLVGESCDPKSELPPEIQDTWGDGRPKIHIGCVTGAKCVTRDEAGEYGECQLIEPLTTTRVPRIWFSSGEGEEKKPPRRKNPGSVTATTTQGERRHRHHHHQRTTTPMPPAPKWTGSGSIKNSFIDYDEYDYEYEYENQEIPIPRAKATSSAPSAFAFAFVSSPSSMCSYLTYFLLCAFAFALLAARILK